MTEKTLKVDPVLVYELADRPGAVWLARQLLATWLADRRVPQATSDDLLLVCSELCTDALRHSEGPVKLRACRQADDIVMEVDAAVDASAGSLDVGTPVSFLDVVESVVDELRIERRGTRTVTQCRKRVIVLPD